ncbi:Receptor-like serine/threonine-protein kinase SD1-8 [Thalictrum thalictroides]|uniref:non-specific serine/threonine protein kinase n=1 Tax=Thalictrum thalictroides TaxID=46969 RepID=A0A7J6UVY1_THATH|nr:Receptor-like serine/threonine-protein kinase SD1-8 [Thalictrum thalictroides]
MKANTIFTYEVVHTADERFYMYHLVNQSVILRYQLTQTETDGHIQRTTWVEKTKSWSTLVSIPRDRCDDYALCGNYSTCDSTNFPVCQCLKKFKPKSPMDWSATDWKQGCERETPLNCTDGDGFIKYTGVKLPETTGSWFNMSMNLKECKEKCLKNCLCMAYANTDIRGDGSGCIMWSTDLTDIRQLNNAGQDLYIRMAASELGSQANSKMKKRVIIIVVFALVAGMIVLGLGIWYLWKMRNLKHYRLEKEDLELPLFDLVTLTNATNKFSEEDKLGEGGFGPVYKGKLEGGQEIAVKRLSKDSIQGVDEFKNEVQLISKLQHRNLVRLLGCCIQGKEKMLVYEYMQNKCLHSFMFDETRSKLLDWQNRLDIILGIARGLLYLHHDSRLKIIHRDLKASNILLDGEMVPKISDFGMARIFGGDQLEASTKRIVGTYGYMSPEYMADGHFSVKSDVFSYGVLVLEIISGKKNKGFYHPDHDHNLLGHAWKLWNGDKCMELVDDSIGNSASAQDIRRCIQVGLLCVQKNSEQRPTMSSVLLMLSSEAVVLPNPQVPGFYIERGPINDNSSYSEKQLCLSDDATITTLLEGR